MEQAQDKYSVAWLKLAEYVSRGQKERALGVYRLLAHSFDNQAIAHQLEGDILLACNEKESAIIQYDQAAQAYQERGEFTQALAVYDHILLLQPSVDILTHMIELSSQLDDHTQMLEYMRHMGHYLLKKQELAQLFEIIETYNLSHEQHAVLLIELLFISINDAAIERHMKLQLINHIVTYIAHDSYTVQQFLMQLKSRDESLHAYARAQMRKD